MQRCQFSAPEHAVIDVGMWCGIERPPQMDCSAWQWRATEQNRVILSRAYLCLISFSVYCMLNTFFTGQEEKLSCSNHLTIMIHAICDSAGSFIALSPWWHQALVCLYSNIEHSQEWIDRCWVNSPIHSRSLFLNFSQTILKYFQSRFSLPFNLQAVI